MIKAKRFWENVSIVEDNGYKILLDTRELMTPFKNTLRAPSKALAEAIAEEWKAVEGEINPEKMPFTKMTNSALERIPQQRAEVESHLIEYLDNDLLIYRADAPDELVERQKAWDEWLAWVEPHDIKLNPIVGIFGEDQPAGNKEAAAIWLSRLNDFQLVPFYEYVVLTGSFVLAMAVSSGALSAPNAFDLSRLDEDFQAETWGMVDVKQEERDAKLAEIVLAANFQALINR